MSEEKDYQKYIDELHAQIEKYKIQVFRLENQVDILEDAIVRAQLISGTHALAITLSALLRPGDTMISIDFFN